MKIISQYEPITIGCLIVTAYGDPGLGKTTLANTADKALNIDFDGGAHRAGNRVDTVQVSSWSDIANIKPSDVAGYKTVIVDTVGRAVDLLQAHVVASDPKNARRDGAPSMQGYGAMKKQFSDWLKRLRTLGVDIVLVSHASEEKDGDDTVERLDITGSTKNEIYKISDVMGRLTIDPNGDRYFVMDPSTKGFGKNPAGLKPVKVTGTKTMSTVIKKTKDSLAKLSEAQQEAQKALADWEAKLDEANDADALTALIEASNKVAESVRAKAKILLMNKAREAGLEFKDGAFV